MISHKSKTIYLVVLTLASFSIALLMTSCGTDTSKLGEIVVATQEGGGDEEGQTEIPEIRSALNLVPEGKLLQVETRNANGDFVDRYIIDAASKRCIIHTHPSVLL